MMQATANAVPEQEYREFLRDLLAGDRLRCAAIARSLCAAGVDIPNLYLRLFQRALYEVGSLWENHRVSVAVEHLATAITERLLTLVHPQIFSGPVRAHSIVIACVEGEHHQLGGRMAADLFELHGWRGDFLGANTPAEDLLSLLDSRQPNMLGFSMSIATNYPALLRALDLVTSAYPRIPILVGGQAFHYLDLHPIQRYPNVTRIASIDELERVVAEYAGR